MSAICETKIKFIQVLAGGLPSNLIPCSVYFLRETGELWQVDGNGTPAKMGLNLTLDDLSDALKKHVELGAVSGNITIDTQAGASFELEMTDDTTINLTNLYVNKQVKLIVKGNYILNVISDEAQVNTTNLDYDSTKTNIIICEVSSVFGQKQINVFNI